MYHKRAGEVGVLKRKRLLKQNISRDSEDLDWALCSFDRNLLKLSNTVLLPDGNILDPKNVAQDDPRDTAVWVNTGPTGVEKGFIITKLNHQKVGSADDIQKIIENGECGILVEGVYPNGMKAYYAFGI